MRWTFSRLDALIQYHDKEEIDMVVNWLEELVRYNPRVHEPIPFSLIKNPHIMLEWDELGIHFIEDKIIYKTYLNSGPVESVEQANTLIERQYGRPI